jgi:YVTN family beta-propeller protein
MASRILAALFFVVAAPVAAAADVLVVVSNAEHAVTLVDPATNRRLARLPTGKGPHEVAVSPDGRYAYVADSGDGPGGTPGRTITVIDLANRAVRATFDLGAYTSPHDLRVSRDGTRLWVACAPARAVLEIDTGTGAVAKAWETGQEGGWMLAVTPDERKIYVANLEGGSVSVVDRASGAIRTIATAPGEIGVDCSPDGRQVWVSNVQTNRVAVIDAASDRVVANFESGGEAPVRVKFTPDGKSVLVVHRASANLVLFDAATRARTSVIDLPAPPKIVTLSRDGERVFLTCPSHDIVLVVDLRARGTVATFPTGKTPDGIAWAGDPRPHNSRVAFTIPERDLIPEGIAYDPATKTFFLGSTYKRKIVSVGPEGSVRDFTAEGQDGLWGLVGMKVDAKRRVLWALSSHAGENMPMRGVDAACDGCSGLFKYDLRTGRLVKKYPLDNAAEKHFLNDLAIGPRGDLFITDSRHRAIYTVSPGRDELELFLSSDQLEAANGIALSDDGWRLFVSTRTGIAAVDVETRKISPVALPDGEPFRADGLYFYRGSLVAVQAWRTGKVVARFFLDQSLDRVERVEVVEGDHPTFLQPTTGVVVGDELYYVANSQLQHFRGLLAADGSYPLERLREVVVLRARL